jgi:hypothetical protein
MRRILLIGAAIAAIASPATAHKGHGGLTVIEIGRDGVVTVQHRFAAHDVEPALETIAPQAQPSLDDPQALAALETHLGQRFRLLIDDEVVAVTHADTQLAGDNVWVEYAGHTDDRYVQAVTVDLDFFPGVHEEQQQQVNVRVDGVTRSVVFRPGSTAQTVRF